MPLTYLIILALIQGLTEFLPVSSSAHLILLPNILQAQDQGVLIDVAVHVGTLVAVCLYFRAEVVRLVRGVPHLLSANISTPESQLLLRLIIATIPVVIVGLLIAVFDLVPYLRSPKIIAWTMIIFGIVLYLTDRFGRTERSEWTTRDALILGLWQALALIPGTSRSGACISGARAIGFGREQSARYAMLMSIPTITASGILIGAEAVSAAEWDQLKDAAIATVLSCLAALAAITVMMRLLKRISFTPYVIYRLILGVALLIWLYA